MKHMILNLRSVLMAAGIAALFCLSGCGRLYAKTPLIQALTASGEAKEESQPKEDKTVLLLTHSATSFSATQKIAGEFKSSAERLSGGQLEVEIFPNDTLGYVGDYNKPLQNGSVEMRIGPAVGNTAMAALWSPSFTGASLEQLNEILSKGPVREQIEAEALMDGVRILSVLPAQFRVLTSNEKIETIQDFSRLHIRVFSDSRAETAYWQSLGAETHVFDIHQVYSALQQGIVNSQENTLPIIIANSLQRQQKYMIRTDHKIYFDCVMVGSAFFDSLSADQQNILTEAAAGLAEYAKKIDSQELARYGEAIGQAGGETVLLSEELLSLMRATAGAKEEAVLRESIGDEAVDLVLDAIAKTEFQ